MLDSHVTIKGFYKILLPRFVQQLQGKNLQQRPYYNTAVPSIAQKMKFSIKDFFNK